MSKGFRDTASRGCRVGCSGKKAAGCLPPEPRWYWEDGATKPSWRRSASLVPACALAGPAAVVAPGLARSIDLRLRLPAWVLIPGRRVPAQGQAPKPPRGRNPGLGVARAACREGREVAGSGKRGGQAHRVSQSRSQSSLARCAPIVGASSATTGTGSPKKSPCPCAATPSPVSTQHSPIAE